MSDERTMDDATRAEIVAAIDDGSAIVCTTKCWPCQFGSHFDPPKWHTWADEDDVDHAAATGQPDPSKGRCGCRCAVKP